MRLVCDKGLSVATHPEEHPECASRADKCNWQADIPAATEQVYNFLPVAEIFSTALIKKWISEQVAAAREGASEAKVNALSVRQELQADCFAGLWGHAANSKRQLLDPGDLEEALQAATAIGDDRLQREAGRQVVPDSFTHGTSEQRVKWFKVGFESGDINACNTFAAAGHG